jgi:adenylate cyclase
MAADEGKRKIAAILAADVAGYSRLMADDDRATVRTLTEYREVFAAHIATHQGRVVDTAGDSVLATFESVIEAAEAAVEIQRELGQRNEALAGHRRMYFRMGVNLGDIIERDDGTIYGDGVNVAARLEGLAEPGGVMVSESAHLHTEDKLGVGVEYIGEHEVKNIPRPVKAYRLLLDGAAPSAAPPKPARRTKLIAGAAIAAAVVAGLAVWGLTLRVEAPQMVMADGTPTDDPVLAIPRGPSVAVLPFDELTDNPPHPHLADGISSQIVSNFTAFSDLFVFALDSTRPLKEAQASPAAVREALGADYVVQGSVQQSNDVVRVTVDLINAESGEQVWSNRYESDIVADRLFNMQDEIATQIVGELGSNASGIMAEDMRRLKRNSPSEMSAYDCVLMEMNYWNVRTPEAHAEVRDCLERAVEAEPNYARAWASLAWNYSDEFMVAYNTRPGAEQRAVDAARRAVNLDPTAYNTNALSQMLYWTGDYDQFRIHAKRALTLNSNDAAILNEVAFSYAGLGEIDLADQLMQKALKLNPNPPAVWFWAQYHIEIGRRDFDAALTAAEKLYVEDFYFSHAALAAAYIGLERQADAERAMQRTLALRPDWTVPIAREEMARFVPWPGLLDYYTDAMRQAGLPEAAPQPERPVIAVLPFDNLSGDPKQDYFADGLSEEIITALTRFRDLLVIAGESTFAYKGQDRDARDVGQELNAGYVLGGSVRRSGERIRVSVKLLDAESGGNLWAETFERDATASDLFAIQDEITDRVVGLIAAAHGTISRDAAMDRERDPPASDSAYDCVLKHYVFNRVATAENHAIARDCLEKTVESYPNYAAAWVGLADLYMEEELQGHNTRPNSIERAAEAARRAVSLDPMDARGHILLAWASSFLQDWDTTRQHADEAIERNSRDAMVLNYAALIYSHLGEWRQGFELGTKAIRLNPSHPGWYNWSIVHYYFAEGDYENALPYARQLGDEWWFWTHAQVAAILAHLGRAEEARAALDRALALKPDLGDAFWSEVRFFFSVPATNAMVEDFAAGLRKAGLAIPPEPVEVQ